MHFENAKRVRSAFCLFWKPFSNEFSLPKSWQIYLFLPLTPLPPQLEALFITSLLHRDTFAKWEYYRHPFAFCIYYRHILKMRMFCHFIANVILSSTHSSSVIYAKCEFSSATSSQNENKSPDIRKMRMNCAKAVGKNHSLSSSTNSHFAYITTSFSFCEWCATRPLF